MSLFFGIPVPPEIGHNLINRLKPVFRDWGVEWFNPEFFHITTAFCPTTPSDNYFIDVFLEKRWMERVVGEAQVFQIELDQLDQFSTGEILVLTKPAGTKCLEWKQILTQSQLILDELTSTKFVSTYPFRPHISLGKLPNNVVISIPAGIAKASLTVQEIALYQKVSNAPAGQYRIVQRAYFGGKNHRTP